MPSLGPSELLYILGGLAIIFGVIYLAVRLAIRSKR